MPFFIRLDLLEPKFTATSFHQQNSGASIATDCLPVYLVRQGYSLFPDRWNAAKILFFRFTWQHVTQ